MCGCIAVCLTIQSGADWGKKVAREQWRNIVTTGPGAGYYDGGVSQWRKAVVPKHFTVPYRLFFVLVTAATPPPPAHIFCL